MRDARSADISRIPPSSAAAGQHHAVVGAERQPRDVRRHETDEADAAGGADGDAREQRAQHEQQHLEPAHVHADARGLGDAARKHVEVTAEQRARDGRDEQQREQPLPALGPRQVAEQPEHHAAQRGVVAQREQQAHDGAGAGRNDHAGQQQARGRPAARPLGQRKHEQARAEGAECRGAVDTGGGQAGHDREQRQHRGTARYAEHVRVGERIAQQYLQHRPGEREEAADREGRQGPRQPQLQHHVACDGWLLRAKGLYDLTDCQRQAARRERQREDRAGDGEQQQQCGSEG